MTITLTLPSQLSIFSKNIRVFELEVSILGDVFLELDKIAPMIRSQIFDADGHIRKFVGVFLNNEQLIEYESNLMLPEASVVLIVMSVAGG